mmetsp:Transcript_102/g.282  ORF Transcript_102/g.282 Transcript_102/m.282 type:complete len:341 (+) Transcript_102:57-1079(+)|eukprot:871945-Amphidinium_carterae.2
MAQVVESWQERATASNIEVPPPLQGWLLKQKSDGSKSRFFSGTNKRFVTLDYTTKLLMYAHSESGKDVKEAVFLPFANFLAVEPLQDRDGDGVDDVEATDPSSRLVKQSRSSASSGFRMPRLRGLSKAKEGSGFKLITKDRAYEFFAGTQEEADVWIRAIARALEQDTGATVPAIKVEPFEPQRSPTISTTASLDNDQCSSSSPPCEQTAQCVDVEEIPISSLDVESRPSREPHRQGMVTAAAADAVHPRARDAGAMRRVQIAQANGGHPPAGPQASPLHSNRVEELSDSRVLEASSAAWQSPKVSEGMPTERYADRHQGMSLRQRLEQLDFSDDEDEAN